MLKEAGNPDTGLWLPPQLKATGRAWPFFWSHEASLPLHCMDQEEEDFTGTTKHSIPKAILEGTPRTENPQLPRKVSTNKQGKAQNKKGPGWGQPMQEPKDSWQSGRPSPGTPTFQQRHRSPPSQGMPVDTAGKSHAPGQSPRTPQSSTSEPVGREWSGQEVLLQGSFSVRKMTGLDANPVYFSL